HRECHVQERHLQRKWSLAFRHLRLRLHAPRAKCAVREPGRQRRSGAEPGRGQYPDRKRRGRRKVYALMPRAPTVILAAGIAVAIACAPAAGGASELVTPPPGDALADAPWVPDLGNGRYRNPVLAADYSDPDVVRVG